MAKQSGSFEWLVIKVETLYKLLVVAVVLLAGGLGYYFYFHKAVDPSKAAQELLDAASTKVDQVRGRLDQSQTQKLAPAYDKLAAARDAMRVQDFATVSSAATEARVIAEKIEEGLVVLGVNQAVVVDLQGTVELKRAASPDYVNLTLNMALQPGDLIRSSAGSQAVIKYSEGTTQLIGSDTIYQIRTLERTASGGLSAMTELQSGTVETSKPSTSDENNQFSIAGPNDMTMVPSTDSRVQMGVQPGGDTTIGVVDGKAGVTHGGATTQYEAGTLLSASDAGAPLKLEKMRRPPVLATPADKQVINTDLGESEAVKFSWDAPASSLQYQLQIGTDPFMSKPALADQVVKDSFVNIKLPPGTLTYYWRVRETDKKVTDPKEIVAKAAPASGQIVKYNWSYTSSFKVFAAQKPDPNGPGGAVVITLNCRLEALSGDQVLVTCKTTPGLTVTIDGVQADVIEGSCRKIVTFPQPGVQTILVKAFDNYGNEKSQILKYNASLQ